MKYLILITVLIVPFLINGQEAVIEFNVKNATTKKIEINNFDYLNPAVLFGEISIDVPLIGGKASWSCNLSESIIVYVFYEDDVKKKDFYYCFYLSPGDKLKISFDANNSETPYMVTGKGSENNQLLIQQIHNQPFSLDAYKKDSVPDNVFMAIKEKSRENHNNVEKYIADYHPTKDFIKIHNLFVQYFPLWEYIDFKGSQRYSAGKSFVRNETKWQAIEDSLTNAISINNEEALRVCDFAMFLRIYLIRLKERVWNHPELAKEYFDTDNPSKTMSEDPENGLMERIIIKHFSGKTAEYLYAILFDHSLNKKEDNLPEIFERFKQKYPQSQYTSYIEPDIQKILTRRKHALTDKMILIENSDSLQTFDDLLKLVKGKTVLLDMWGTWCSPCRSELLANSDSIKNHYKGKALDYLYIANYDLRNAAKWKELIPYYNLTGTHILAHDKLTEDIMARIKGGGYPTYAIIKKDGTFELSEAGYPMKRKLLYKQIDKILNE